jgi:hypothetical protein
VHFAKALAIGWNAHSTHPLSAAAVPLAQLVAVTFFLAVDVRAVDSDPGTPQAIRAPVGL